MPFIFEKDNKEKDNNWIKLNADIVNMGLQCRGLGKGHRPFTQGIYFKKGYAVYTNGHFLVYKKVDKKDENLKVIDGELWNFEKHKKPKKSDSHIMYKRVSQTKAMSDYGTVEISCGVTYPNIAQVLPNIDKEKYLAAGLNPYYLEIIQLMMGGITDNDGHVSGSNILINTTDTGAPMVLINGNAGAILMPVRPLNIDEQLKKHTQHKKELEKIF